MPRLKERPEGEEEGGDYFIDLKDRAVSPTEEGIDKMESWLGVENLYDADPRLARHFDQASRLQCRQRLDQTAACQRYPRRRWRMKRVEGAERMRPGRNVTGLAIWPPAARHPEADADA